LLRRGCLRRASFTVPTAEDTGTCTMAKTDRALDQEIALENDFLSASHIRPNFDLNRRPGRSDAPPGSQGDVNALLSSLCPNIRLALQAINAPILHSPSLFRRASLPHSFSSPPRSFRCLQEKQVILKNGLLASAIAGLHTRGEIPSPVHPRNALRAHHGCAGLEGQSRNSLLWKWIDEKRKSSLMIIMQTAENEQQFSRRDRLIVRNMRAITGRRNRGLLINGGQLHCIS